MNKNVTRTEYAVEINNEKGFVRQIEVFQSYKEAEDFIKTTDEELSEDEYFNIIFIDYNENDDEIDFGTVC